MKEILTGKQHLDNGNWVIVVSSNGTTKTFQLHPNPCLHVGIEFVEGRNVTFQVIRYCSVHQCDITYSSPCTLDCAFDEVKYAKILESLNKETPMVFEGSLIKDEHTGKLVVRYNKTGKKSTEALENLELDHDSFIDYYIDGKIVEPWYPIKVKFEIIKKFLANETQYIAKLIKDPAETGWSEITKEWIKFCKEHVDEDHMKYGQWLKTHYNPPTRKKS